MIRFHLCFSFLVVALMFDASYSYAHGIRLSSIYDAQDGQFDSGISEKATISIYGKYTGIKEIVKIGEGPITIPRTPNVRGPIDDNFQLPDNDLTGVLGHLKKVLGQDVPAIVLPYVDSKPTNLEFSYQDAPPDEVSAYFPERIPEPRLCAGTVVVKGLVDGKPVDLEAIRFVFSRGEWSTWSSKPRPPGGSYLKCRVEAKYKPIVTRSEETPATDASMESGRVAKSSGSVSLSTSSSSLSSSSSVSSSSLSSSLASSSSKGN